MIFQHLLGFLVAAHVASAGSAPTAPPTTEPATPPALVTPATNPAVIVTPATRPAVSVATTRPRVTPATKPAKVSTASTRGGANSSKLGGHPFPPATPEAVSAVTSRVFPAVVRIDAATEVYVEGKRDVRRGIGSGVIIDREGRILTNFHVAGHAAELYVTLANKERVPAHLIGEDHWTDLAVIQLDLETVQKRSITFDFAELGDSNALVPGENVMAIGTPFGLARTITLGVVSNNERTFYPQRLTIENLYETGDFSNWIQMDTPINPGNSGGPLVDMNAKVVGINTRGGGENLNFAIPMDTAREVIAKLLANASPGHKGKVERSDLGIEFKPMQDLEAFYKMDINKGVLVNSVEANSPASKAGVHPQDILIEINDTPINVRFPEELAPTRRMIADLPIGSDVKLSLRRGEETIEVTAKTEKLQSMIGEEKELKEWGMSVREITRKYANDEQLDDNLGVVVTSLSTGLPAHKAELHSGDVIRKVNSTEVADLDAFMKLYDALVKAKQPTVIMQIQHGRGSRTVVLKMTH